ncbi:MarR family winged helix-turn-helix transcriptional regulator [Actinacidiphila glaucinigra]|uniref:MarR family winged helix-turn-helix transcriptional regulator n=1 Tax=Actinacidiphila glaucinigra TaxID=235986 RepID=UPI003698CCDF
MREQPPHPNDQRRWLTPAEQETWQQFGLMMHRLPTALEAQLQQDAHLSYLEYYVLAGLSEQPGHRMRMSDLAVRANSEQSRLSHLISRLERRGLVRREPDPTNGRYTQAILTEGGYAHLADAAPGHVARVRDLVFDVLDSAELDTLRTAAKKINEKINLWEQETSPRKNTTPRPPQRDVTP